MPNKKNTNSKKSSTSKKLDNGNNTKTSSVSKANSVNKADESINTLQEGVDKVVKLVTNEEPSSSDNSKDIAREPIEILSKYVVMGVSVVLPIELIKGSNSILIENLGMGDVYFSDGGIFSYSNSNLILTGSSKEFKQAIYLIASSRPNIKITYLK